MCITDPDHKTKRHRGYLGCDRCGGKPLLQRGRRALVVTTTPIILTHLLIPALIPGPRRYSADWCQNDHLCSTSPRTCPAPTYNNRPLSSMHLHHKATRISQFSRSWGFQILGFRTQGFRLQRCRARNSIPTSHSCSETGIFFSLVGV